MRNAAFQLTALRYEVDWLQPINARD